MLQGTSNNPRVRTKRFLFLPPSGSRPSSYLSSFVWSVTSWSTLQKDQFRWKNRGKSNEGVQKRGIEESVGARWSGHLVVTKESTPLSPPFDFTFPSWRNIRRPSCHVPNEANQVCWHTFPTVPSCSSKRQKDPAATCCLAAKMNVIDSHWREVFNDENDITFRWMFA